MNIGLHVSAAGGSDLTVKRAVDWGCETFQFFSRSPQGGPAPKLTREIVSSFKQQCADAGISETLIHTPYFINLCSTNPKIKHGSVSIIREELERASLLGVTAVVTHLGAAKELDPKKAVAEVAKGVKKILTGYKGSAFLLLENAAGSGSVVGSTFEQLKQLISAAPKNARIGVCLDTCHLFAAGYNLKTTQDAKKTFALFNKIVGITFLKFIHVNDSKFPLGDHKDRHEHIGDGHIGIEGFKALMSLPALKHIPFILETEHDGKHLRDLARLISYRKNK